MFDDDDMLTGATLVKNVSWQAYIGADPIPNDVFCVKYASSATELTILTITFVVFFSCLVVVVAAMVIYYRRRRRRHRTTGVVTAAGTAFGDRYTEVVRRSTNDYGTHDKIGGNVRISFRIPQFDDDDDDDDDDDLR